MSGNIERSISGPSFAIFVVIKSVSNIHPLIANPSGSHFHLNLSIYKLQNLHQLITGNSQELIPNCWKKATSKSTWEFVLDSRMH